MRKLAVGLCVVGSACAAQAVDLPTMGWSSWNTYRVNISEELIKRQADALVDGGFAALGYKYVNIDDGWFGGRDKNGRHTTNPKRFPNGLKPVVDYIHARGSRRGPILTRARTPADRSGTTTFSASAWGSAVMTRKTRAGSSTRWTSTS